MLLFFSRNQQGVSGMENISIRNSAEGTAPTNATPPLAQGTQDEGCKRPTVTASWSTEPSIPLIRAATISVM